MSSNEGKRKDSLSPEGAKLPVYAAMLAIFRFSLQSLRGRIGQAVPVTLALLLIVGAAQAIGALGDVSSTLTRQQIAAHWRASADLFVRPQAAVSQPERDAGWIDPQSALDDYGGISAKQVASIASLSQVTQIVPFASVGWRRIDVVMPVVLPQKGVYRITAQWTGARQWAGSTVDYVEVSDLASLTGEEPLLQPLAQHLVLPANANSVVYTMSVPALQMLVGVTPAQENTLRQILLQRSNPTSSDLLTIHVERLHGQMTMLPSCMTPSVQAVCWQPIATQMGRASTYLAQDVQLLRYSPARYSATAQQLAAGQLSLDTLGTDTQGSIYRTLLPQHLMLPDDGATGFSAGIEQQAEVVPLTGPEHMPVLPDALQFMPLARACLVNGERCYSGLYVRLRGVDRYNSKSLALLQATAATITARTGLHVDILDGSSTRAVTLQSGNANNGLTSTWRVVGVAVQIKRGVDALQSTLFILCAMICLLAIGTAGVLIGIGRKNEARVLEQLGWSVPLRVGVSILDTLWLVMPGCVLASLLIALGSKFWPVNIPSAITWALLASGVIFYGISLVSLANAARRGRRRLRPSRSDSAFQARVTAPLACSFAIIAAVFLVAIEYLMVSGLNRDLGITVLGEQVHVALEGPQLLLAVLVLMTALLTVGLCTSLLLLGRREELALLAKMGWERRHVLLRLLRESWRMAALSGVAGVLLALGVIEVAGTLPPLWVVGSVLLGGPMLGMLLASLVVFTLAWQELKSIYLKRAERWT